ncbi:PucR family transcriptional regulator [Nocardia sp. BMG111209]|uniref:PucR family transcriptional regulator n=1 Tax=Nocardia sp. BMG111209 TaxID=1160137 RepID=UPI000381D435|nr:PucR family transcriptional regulator [Nocardia sp. BMG111209]
MTPAVSLRWVLAQADLALRLRGGDQGLDHEIDLVLTTELGKPFPWLSGGELVLTTGLRLPGSWQGRTAYLRGLQACGVAGLGFGIGLSHPEIPGDLIRTADRIGLPLLEVPLPTPFAAVIKRVSERLAELRYEEAVQASRAQPRMTRAVVAGGAPAVVRELAGSLGGTIVMLDRAGTVRYSAPPEAVPDLPAEISADSGVSTDPAGGTVTWQQIAVGRKRYGRLVAVTAAPLSNIGRILLGHAVSLLALEFAKTARLESIQQSLNTQAFELVLGSAGESSPARDQLAAAADAHGRIRIMVVRCVSDADAADAGREIADVLERTDLPRFIAVAPQRTIVALPAQGAPAFAHRLSDRLRGPLRQRIRIGLSAPHPLAQVTEAVDAATLAASAAALGDAPLEFGPATGTALLASATTRAVLDTVATAVLDPLIEHDRVHGTELFGSLRAFLEANGHWESAATALGVHRHTMRNRIGAIGSIIDCDLNLARVRAELLLAILSRTT